MENNTVGKQNKYKELRQILKNKELKFVPIFLAEIYHKQTENKLRLELPKTNFQDFGLQKQGDIKKTKPSICKILSPQLTFYFPFDFSF